MRQRTLFPVLAASAFLLAAGGAWAQATPAGLWKTIDDGTKKEKSLVRIVESGGVYTGRVEKILDTTAPADAVCKDCTDERKDKPVLGMTIVRNVRTSNPQTGARRVTITTEFGVLSRNTAAPDLP